MSRALTIQTYDAPALPAANAVKHYVYASRSAKGVWSDDEIDALASRAQAHNDAVGIRGVLLVLRDYFVQWLEGPADAVDALVDRIRSDARHLSFVELHSATGAPTLPRAWLTVRANRTEPAADIDARFAAFEKFGNGEIATMMTPAALLRSFALPAQVPKNDFVTFHAEKLKVVLAADDLLWPAAIVHAVARRNGLQPQRTLFSQLPLTPEAASGCVEYLDVAKSSRHAFPLRLSACASPTVSSAYAESVFSDADIVVFLVRASRVDAERERLSALMSLPCFANKCPHLVLMFSHAAESSRNEFLRDLPLDRIQTTVHTLSLSDSDAIAEILFEAIDRVAAARPVLPTTREKIHANAKPAVTATSSTTDAHARAARSAPLYLVHDQTRMSEPTTTIDETSVTPPEHSMANVSTNLQTIMKIDGATACALVDYTSGMMLGSAGGGVNLEVAAAGNTEVIRAKMKVAKALGLDAAIEDILITLSNQYHIIRPIAAKQGLFYYVVIDRSKGNLAMARFQIADAEKQLQM